MNKALLIALWLPLFATGQQPVFQNVFAGPVASKNGYGLSAGATLNTGFNWTAQLVADAFRPSISTKQYYEGEKLVCARPAALFSIGADLLYMPDDYTGYVARTYATAGVRYGPYPENAFAQAGAGINSKVLDISLVYRLGFGHYETLSGWHLRVVKPFSLITKP